MRKICFLLVFLLSTFLLMLDNNQVFGQPGCASVTITTNNGNDFALPCASPCTTLSATAIQTSGETNTYSVSSVPYAPPYAFNTGTPILVNIDDTWSDVITLPFTFCFYGTSYTQIIAGSNGVVSFATGDAGTFCEWEFSATCPSPDLIPAGNIFGPYHDLDPSVAGTMYYAILGSYPCRTFVVNWNEIAMFDCNSMISTHQVVLYETSNIIEVYMQSIPLCTTWNDGNSLVGIQNPAGTVGISPPGRNTGVWSTSNEAWRFTPTGSSTVGITWFQGATQIGTGNSINVCPVGPTTYTAQATYTTCFGIPVTVDDDITLSLSGGSVVLTPTDPTICSGESVTINATGSDTYTWSPSTGLNQDTGSSVIASPTITTIYTVTGVVPGCTTTNTVTVNVNSLTLPTFTQLGPYCVNETPDILPVTSTNGINGTWNSAINTATAGTTIYTFTPTAGQCASTTTMSITIDPLPVITFSPMPQLCTTSPAFTLSQASPVGGTYSGTGVTGTSFDPSVAGIGTHVITYNYTDPVTTCSNTSTTQIIITNGLTINVTPNNPSLCLGGNILLSATGATNFNWQPNIGLSDTTGTSVIASPTITTIYSVTGSNPDGCVGSTTVAVNVYNVPTVSIVSFPHEGCTPLNVSFVYIPNWSIDTNTIQWNFGDPNSTDNVSNLMSPNHVFNYDGLYTVYLSALTNDGCPVYISDTIKAYHKPIADFYFNPQVGYMDNPNIGFVDLSVGANTWSWNFGDPSSNNYNYSDIENPHHTYTDTGNYFVELIVSSTNNCYDTITKPIIIYPSILIYIPNAFTPNKDQWNDVWKPSITGIDENNYHLLIYDRWGKILFNTNDVDEGWDGKYNDNECAEAVYVYMIEYQSKPGKKYKIIRGTVALIR